MTNDIFDLYGKEDIAVKAMLFQEYVDNHRYTTCQYVTAKELIPIFKKALDRWKNDGSTNVYNYFEDFLDGEWDNLTTSNKDKVNEQISNYINTLRSKAAVELSTNPDVTFKEIFESSNPFNKEKKNDDDYVGIEHYYLFEGKDNTGTCNSGDFNSGYRNSGNFNSGNFNSGNFNSGNRNTGDRNTGDCNTGDCNTGNFNSGNFNSGDFNSGDRNSGDFNSGDFNKADRCTGVFCTENEPFRMFNKPTDWTYEDWRRSRAFDLLCWDLPRLETVEWISADSMSDNEKKAHPDYEVTGGYLKVLNIKESNQVWWESLSESDKKAILSLPNFDKAIFEDVLGIKIGNEEVGNE